MSKKQEHQKNKTAGLQDVARLAGVSIATVSRMLNSSGPVNADTRKKINRAIKELDYKPSRVAQRLRSTHKKTLLLGLMIPDIQNPFFSEIARAVEDEASLHEYAVMICNTDENPKKEEFYLSTLRSEQVAGLICALTTLNPGSLYEQFASQIPMVCIDRKIDGLKGDSVLVKNAAGAKLATEYLISLGHQRIGTIQGDPELFTTKERVRGYYEALSENGISVDPNLIVHSAPNPEQTDQLIAQLLDLQNPPTALFCGYNMLSLSVLDSMNRLGVKVPDKLSLIGFDDIPWANALNPALTVVKQPSALIGKWACRILLEKLEAESASTTAMELEPEIIVRNSCKKKEIF